MDLEAFQRDQRELARLERVSATAEGALAQSLKGLEDLLGTKDVEEAKRELARLERKAKDLEGKWERGREAWLEKWGGKLEEGK